MHQPPQLVVLLAVLLALSAVAPGIASGVAHENTGTAGGSPVAADASTGVTMVSECQEITTPGYYQLATDLLDRTEELCIRIFASDVVFDGAGHRIDGVGQFLFTDDGTETSTKGILVKQGPHTNVTIKNVEVTEYGYGLWVGDTEEGRIVNNTFRDNGIYGIYLGYDANNNTVADNRVINTTSPGEDEVGQGIVIANIANRNDVVNNYVRESEVLGIAIHLGNHTRVVNNTVLDSGRHGITGGNKGTVIVDNVVKRSGKAGIAGEGEGTVIVDNVVAQSGGVGINYARANGTRISGNEVRNNVHGIKFGQSDDAVISRNVIAENDQHGISLHGEAGDIVLRQNTFEDNAEWDILSEEHTNPITVEQATLGDGTTASFEGRQIAVAGSPTPPEPLPEGARAVGGYLKVWSAEGDHSWLDLTLSYDPSSAEGGDSISLWVYRGTWRHVPSSAVEGGPAERSTNVTESGRTIYIAVAASSEETPERTPTAGGTPGFGIAVALVALLLAGLIARDHCG